jgi:hypothetical protein
MGMAGAAKTVAAPVENPTWETLGQNATQAAQYEALGYTPESAHDLILARFDYSFSWSSLIVMVVVITASAPRVRMIFFMGLAFSVLRPNRLRRSRDR